MVVRPFFSSASLLNFADHNGIISIHGGQEFIRLSNAFKNNQSKWVQITLPHIHANSFILALANAIAQLENDKIFAAHFVAQGPANAFLSLGPSIVIHNHSDPHEIKNHLADIFKFYEESYDIKLDNFIFLRLRDLGFHHDNIQTLYKAVTKTHNIHGPWGTVRASANLPFPNFDFLRILKKFLDFINSFNDFNDGLFQCVILNKFTVDGIKLTVFQPNSFTMVFPNKDADSISCSLVDSNESFFTYDFSYRNCKLYYINTPKNILIPFTDIELDDSIISRNVRGFNEHL